MDSFSLTQPFLNLASFLNQAVREVMIVEILLDNVGNPAVVRQ